jgi:hypothetical protein
LRLTAYTDYALRVLVQVAAKDEGRVRIAEVAETFGISRNHLAKIVHQLGTHGCLRPEARLGRRSREFPGPARPSDARGADRSAAGVGFVASARTCPYTERGSRLRAWKAGG